jgi:zinc transport system substrate-binding protein
MAAAFGRTSLLVGLIAGLGVAGCGIGDRAPSFDPADGVPLVVTTIFPIADLVSTVAGDAVEATVLLPAGSSPATFELTPRHLEESERAALVFAVGGGLDGWVSGLVARSGTARVVTLAQGIPLVESGHDHGHAHGGEEETGNPHIWLDPILVRDRLLPKIVSALSEELPAHAQDFRARAEALHDSLSALDQEIRTALVDLEGRGFIATHSAWVYYASRYGLREVGSIHDHPGAEPSARELGAMVEQAREAGVAAIFSEPQIGEAAARALATELDVPVLMLDPLGGPGVEERDGYLALLRFNTRVFVEGLGGAR